jgi:hypothetical protein
MFRSISNLSPPKKENQKNSPPFNLKVGWVKNPLALCKVGPSNMWEIVVTWMLVCTLQNALCIPNVNCVRQLVQYKTISKWFLKRRPIGFVLERAFRPWWNFVPYPFRMKRASGFVLENGWCMASSGSYQVSGLTSRKRQGNNLKVSSRRNARSFSPFKLSCQKLICKL